jgi:hypothetical protein
MPAWGVDEARLKRPRWRQGLIVAGVIAVHVVAIMALTNWFGHSAAKGPGLIRVFIYPAKPAAAAQPAKSANP